MMLAHTYPFDERRAIESVMYIVYSAKAIGERWDLGNERTMYVYLRKNKYERMESITL